MPLKVDTGGPTWGEWARKYPPPGRGIPMIYVIRADGKQIFGQSGALSGSALPQMMQAMLQQSGRVFSDQQLASLDAALAQASAATESGDTFAAVKALSSVSKLGPLGELGSYAGSARAADALVKELTEQAKAKLLEIEQQLNSEQDKLMGAVAFAETRRVYAPLPTLKTDLAAASRTYDRRPDLKDVLSRAEMLDRAKALAAMPKGEGKAILAFERIISSYPDSPIAALAAAELKKVAGDNYDPKPATSTSKVSTWTDITGKFQVQAALVDVEGDKVVLRKEDGQVIRVPISQLSEVDRARVK